MATEFQGFSPESFKFFRELAENNNKSWFDRNRGAYEQHVLVPFRGLLEAIEPFLLKLSPHFETGGKTNRNFSRINRDIRFSKDKSPYKANYYLYVFDRRGNQQSEGRLYAGLSAECITVGFATYASWKAKEKSALETVFRKRFQAYPEVFNGLLDRIVRQGHYQTYWHRHEAGDWTQHPGLPRREQDWLTLQAWIIRKVFAPGARAVQKPAFAQRVQQIFAQLYPLYVFTSMASPKWQAELDRAA
jgi:uncharacterized protein (TIGR02453 family)